MKSTTCIICDLYYVKWVIDTVWMKYVNEIKNKLNILYNKRFVLDADSSNESKFVFCGAKMCVITNTYGHILRIYDEVAHYNKINNYIVFEFVGMIIVYDTVKNYETYKGSYEKVLYATEMVTIKCSDRLIRIFREGFITDLNMPENSDVFFVNDNIAIEINKKELLIYDKHMNKIKVFKNYTVESVACLCSKEYMTLKSNIGGIQLINDIGEFIFHDEHADIKMLNESYMFITMDFISDESNRNPNIDKLSKVNSFYRRIKKLGTYANGILLGVYDYSYNRIFTLTLDDEFIEKYDLFGIGKDCVILVNKSLLEIIPIEDGVVGFSINITTSVVECESEYGNGTSMFKFEYYTGKMKRIDTEESSTFYRSVECYYHIIQRDNLYGICDSKYKVLVDVQYESIEVLSKKDKLFVVEKAGVKDIFDACGKRFVGIECAKVYSYIENIRTLVCEVDNNVKMIKI